MADWEAELDGLETTLAELQDITMELTADAVYVTGTNVEYSIYQELGTRHMAPNPFFRPAINDARREADRIVAEASDANDAIKRLALFIERRAKHYATTGVPPGPDVDTGTLRASIRAERIS